MDTFDTYRQIVMKVLEPHVRTQYAHGEIHNEAVFDHKNNRYLIVSVGWQNDKRIYGNLIHLDLIGDKVWIQYDGTEEGIAYDLEEAGIPKKQIVLGFHDPAVWSYTGYAATA